MILSRRVVLLGAATLAGELAGCSFLKSADARPPTTAFHGARWFNGEDFQARDVWSVAGYFTFEAPSRIDTVIDLNGAFVIPPFADAHNHGVGTGVEERDRAMIDAYLRAGVFYMRSMGNLPLSTSDQAGLGLNAPTGLDAVFAQGSITGAGGHPEGIIRNRLLPQGYFPGRTLDTLQDVRFYEVSSESELRAKWPLIRAARGDLIKFMLFNSDEFAARRDDPAYFGRRGLDPALASSVVSMAHADGLPAAAHIVNVADFRTALDSGVDIIGHLPSEGLLTDEDARRAARSGVEVVTTSAFLALPARTSPEASAAIAARQKPNLEVLKNAGVRLTIGSDDPADPTSGEIEHLRQMGVFSDVELLRMWTEASARAIFPDRKIGRLAEGYEATFLALEGDPTQDWTAVDHIRMRFKQGYELAPIS